MGHNCNELTTLATTSQTEIDDFQLCSNYHHHHSGSGAVSLMGGAGLSGGGNGHGSGGASSSAAGNSGVSSGLPIDRSGRGMEKITPPSSPSISKYSFDIGGSGSKSGSGSGGSGGSHDDGCLELQLDYWTTENCDLHLRKSESEKSKKQDSKLSIKTYFRSLVISNLAAGSDSTDFTMKYTTKEKRPKAVLKLGKKKEKPPDNENKIQTIEGIDRLICSTVGKSSHPLKVSSQLFFF